MSDESYDIHVQVIRASDQKVMDEGWGRFSKPDALRRFRAIKRKIHPDPSYSVWRLKLTRSDVAIFTPTFAILAWLTCKLLL